MCSGLKLSILRIKSSKGKDTLGAISIRVTLTVFLAPVLSYFCPIKILTVINSSVKSEPNKLKVTMVVP
jgi:hypothetical protein